MMVVARLRDREGNALVQFDDGLMLAVMHNAQRAVVLLPKGGAPPRYTISAPIPQQDSMRVRRLELAKG